MGCAGESRASPTPRYSSAKTFRLSNPPYAQSTSANIDLILQAKTALLGGAVPTNSAAFLPESRMQEQAVGQQIVGPTRTHFTTRSGTLARWAMGTPMIFRRNSEIYGEAEPVDYVYEVAHGAVRTVKVLSDGRRQIGGFYFAGDIFGLEDGNCHSFSAEAIVDSTVRIVRRKSLIRLAGHDRELAQRLLIVTSQEVSRVHNHALMLIKTAQERVASFLVEMSERISICALIELPMSRQDIADYLGITIETVSRTFTSLESQSTISLPNARAVIVRDLSALRQ